MSKIKHKKLQNSKKKLIIAGIVILLIAIIGAVLILLPKAATDAHFIEPETSAVSSTININNDSTASGGKSISFNGCLQNPSANGCSTSNNSFPIIASNFDTSQWVGGNGIPESTANEPSGNFRFICGYSHLAYDDPIVYPGQPNASHLHIFFGNTKADANSTYESLRTTGDGTCDGGPLNRSAYWAPVVFNASGKVVIPNAIAIYYKGTFGGIEGIRKIQAMPRGLRMIAGYNQVTKDDSSFNWYCDITQIKTKTVQNCPSGQQLGAVLAFPMCWNGKDLDSPDHRAHMAYTIRNQSTGAAECPTSHPVHLPEFTLGAWYPTDGNSVNWKLSSDDMMAPGMGNGRSFHSDWFGAWDDNFMDTWVKTCINGLLNCHGGNLGNGTGLKSFGFTGIRHGSYLGPQVIDPPVKK